MTTKDQRIYGLANECGSLTRKVAYQKKKAGGAEKKMLDATEKWGQVVKENRALDRYITRMRIEINEVMAEKQKLHNDLENSEIVVENQIDYAKNLEAKLRGNKHDITDLNDRKDKLKTANDELIKIGKNDQAHINDVEQHRNSLLSMLEHYKRNQLDALSVIELGLYLFYPEIHREKLKNQVDPTDPQPRLFLRMFDILNKTHD